MGEIQIFRYTHNFLRTFAAHIEKFTTGAVSAITTENYRSCTLCSALPHKSYLIFTLHRIKFQNKNKHAFLSMKYLRIIRIDLLDSFAKQHKNVYLNYNPVLSTYIIILVSIIIMCCVRENSVY